MLYMSPELLYFKYYCDNILTIDVFELKKC